jgi:tRNA 2-selenouridine synthase
MQLISAQTFSQAYASYDLIIDARSPSEYAHSHFPHSVNLYALDDTQRHEVGVMYKQDSKFEAKILGASYICTNVAEHLLHVSKRVPPGGRIAIYCARGGLRSGSIGSILDQIGYRVERIKGGYKALRKEILLTLEAPKLPPFITLYGNTGCGKTELISRLSPSIDLEALANHKGSVFGGVNHKQPSMKMFQNLLACELWRLETMPFCFIEGESKRIGSLVLPTPLHKAMYSGKKVYITAPLHERVARIKKEYMGVDAGFFHHAMSRIARFISKETKQSIEAAFAANDLDKTIELLLMEYYDKVYKQHTGSIQLTHDEKCLDALYELSESA